MVPAQLTSLRALQAAAALDESHVLGACGAEPYADAFKANAAWMDALVETLRGDVAAALQGGGAAAVARHHARGKLLPRERVQALIDPGAPFLELSQLAGGGLYGEEAVPAGGLVTGVGVVRGRLVAIVANDATVKACLF